MMDDGTTNGVFARMDKERQLTNSVPDEFAGIAWVKPEIVHFTAKDKKSIPAMIYKPAGFDSTKKYPVVVFVHGAGYLQNVFRGWSYYYREYMFHHRLTQKGYVVFEVEYRGSAGLGRDFRTNLSRRDRIIQQPVVHDGEGIGSLKWRLAGEHFV